MAHDRIPRREELVAKEYGKSVREFPPAGSGEASFQQIMSEPAAPKLVLAAERLGLPTDLSRPALKLATLLCWLHPMLNERQRSLVKEQFGCMLRECMRPFEVEVFASAKARQANSMLRATAVLEVSWVSFFGRVFASKAGSDVAVEVGKGLSIDIDHPLASKRALITEKKLVNDLQRFRAWIEADFSINKMVYVDVATVLGEFSRQQKLLGRKPSLRELGAALGRAPTTIGKALRSASLGNIANSQRGRYAKR